MKKIITALLILSSLAMSAQQIYIYPTTQSQYENIGTINVPITLNNAGANATSVTLQLVPSATTATAGSDFIFSDTTIVWGAGVNGIVVIPIIVMDDSLYELDETVTVKLTNPTNGATLGDSVFTLTIRDNDPLSFADCSDLFFSEYVEGTSNNKAIEIYNPTNLAVSLSDYRLFLSVNGGSSSGTFPLSGTLVAGEVYVVAFDQSDSLLKLKADTLTPFLNFDGNDALALLHLNDTIDVIGQIGVNPGTSWPVGSGSTAAHTLIRHYYTYKGNSDWNTAVDEWVAHPVNLFDSLGFHHTAPCGTPDPLTLANIRFVSANSTVAEGNIDVAVVVETINPGAQAAHFVVARDEVASTAIAGADYNYTNQTLSNGLGTTYDTVHIAVLDDNLIESAETVVLRFINLSSNVKIAADSVYTLTITDSDVLSVGFVGAGFTYPEDTGLVEVRIALSTPANDTVRVKVSLAPGNATPNVDFIFNDTLVTFLPNSSDTQGVWVTIIDDQLHEGNEQINFNLSDSSGGAILGISAYTLTIIDNDTLVGIGALALDGKVKLYPNPVIHQLVLETAIDLPEVEMTDMLGNLMMNSRKMPIGKNYLDVSALAPGIYFIQIKDEDLLVTKKFIKTAE